MAVLADLVDQAVRGSRVGPGNRVVVRRRALVVPQRAVAGAAVLAEALEVVAADLAVVDLAGAADRVGSADRALADLRDLSATGATADRKAFTGRRS